MAQLPNFQSPDRILQMMQSQWASILNPVLKNPSTNPRILSNISLISGATVINHGLGAMQQGWILMDVSAAATIYRSQPLNDLTLTLTSNAACVVSLMVF